MALVDFLLDVVWSLLDFIIAALLCRYRRIRLQSKLILD
jgi:hypothetical protein